MQEIKLKKKKHLLVIQVPSDMSTDAMRAMAEKFFETVPDLNLMLTQAETEMTVLTLED